MNAYLPYVRAFLSDERYVATLAANYKLDATKLTELAAGSLRYTPQKQPKHNLWWLREYCCFEVSFAAHDPRTAQKVGNDLLERVLYTNHDIDLRRLVPHAPRCPQLEGAYLDCSDTGFGLYNPVSLPERPTPDPRSLAMLGAFLGSIVAIVWELGRCRN
ncbi:MAG TPA: hypothetical protein VKE70_02670 [Candidatus Solibacter sp.]|nr:hypothetical protein [Candidatus Solibacter sp.]